MAKTYTESELIAMGLTQEQINAVANESAEEKQGEIVEMQPRKTFAEKVQEELEKPLAVTSISSLKRQSSGELVQLPGFTEEEDFVARMRRPSLLAMVKKGKIPNTLLSEATELFSNGTSTIGKDGSGLEDLMQVVEIICEASLVEPTWKEIQDAGIELTDEQMMAIFSYSQRGVAGVRQFRN